MEVDQAGGEWQGRFGGEVTWLTEADVAVPTEPEELEVELAVVGDPAVELRRVLGRGRLRYRAIEHMGLVRREVDRPEQVPVHGGPIAVGVEWADWIIFVEIIGAQRWRRRESPRGASLTRWA